MSERKTMFPIVLKKKKNVCKQDIPFQKEWTIKQENNKDNSKLSVFLLIE